MRSICRLWMVLGLLAVPAVCAWAQDAGPEWRTAAKNVINHTAALLEDKVKGDDAAVAGVKKTKEQLLQKDELNRVGMELKEKLGTDKPTPAKMKDLQGTIKEKVEKADPEQTKRILREKEIKTADLPWPWGKG